jgi:hypothetical protein
MKIQIMDTTSFNFLHTRSPWMPIQSLRNNGLYVISARNAYLGIWNQSIMGFTIARERFNPLPGKNGRFVWHHHGWDIFVEYHWDTGEPLGTAKPFALVEMADKVPVENQLSYLLGAQERLSMPDACELVVG